MSIGENIREKRKAAGLTQDQLAKQVGVSFQMISAIERGQKLPGIFLLSDISKVLSCLMDDLCPQSEM